MRNFHFKIFKKRTEQPEFPIYLVARTDNDWRDYLIGACFFHCTPRCYIAALLLCATFQVNPIDPRDYSGEKNNIIAGGKITFTIKK